MSKSGDYWNGRRVKLYEQVEKNELKLAAKLNRYYKTEGAKLARQIAAYYQEYGEKNVIEYKKLLTTISKDDRQLLFSKMDDFARKYPQYAHLLPVRESIYKLDELEAIHQQMRLQQLEIGARENDVIKPVLEGDALKASNLVAEQMGFGKSFYMLGSGVIKLTVGAKWADGSDFSGRIWSNKQRLADFLHHEFAQGVARGTNYATMARQLREKFEDRSKYEAMRLIRTEASFVLAESQKQAYLDLYGSGAAYSLSTVTDGSACSICKDIENETVQNPVLFTDAEVGINYPPIHPNCKCSVVFALAPESERIEAWRGILWGDED